MRLVLALMFMAMGGAALIQDTRGQVITQTCSNGTQSTSIGAGGISQPCPAAGSTNYLLANTGSAILVNTGIRLLVQ